MVEFSTFKEVIQKKLGFRFYLKGYKISRSLYEGIQKILVRKDPLKYITAFFLLKGISSYKLQHQVSSEKHIASKRIHRLRERSFPFSPWDVAGCSAWGWTCLRFCEWNGNLGLVPMHSTAMFLQPFFSSSRLVSDPAMTSQLLRELQQVQIQFQFSKNPNSPFA